MSDAVGLPMLHGHVIPNNFKARCGGPGMCKQCTQEQALVEYGKKLAFKEAADKLFEDPIEVKEFLSWLAAKSRGE